MRRALPPRGRRTACARDFGVLPLDRRPALFAKGALDLRLGRQRMKQRLHEAEPGLTALADELDRGQVHLVRAHLAVADDAVARELETGDAKVGDLHSGPGGIEQNLTRTPTEYRRPTVRYS